MKTLNHLRNEARQKLEYGITFFLKRIQRQEQAFSYFEPPKRLRDPWMLESQQAKACRDAFEAARAKGDLLEASKHFVLKERYSAPAMSTDAGRVAGLLQTKFELVGLNEVIGWLETLEKMVSEKAKPSEFLNAFVQMGLTELHCDCDQSFMDSPSLAWVHHNHSLLNQALWEIAEAYGIKRLRRVLKRDLAGPETFFNDIDGNPELDEPYGKILAKAFSKKLLDSFLLAGGPSEDWVRKQAPELACA